MSSQRSPGWKMKLHSRPRILVNLSSQSTKWIPNLELILRHSSHQWLIQGPCQFPPRSLWLDGHSPTWPHSAGPLSVMRDPFPQQRCPQASPLRCPLWQLDLLLFLPLESTRGRQHPWSAPGSPRWTRVQIVRWEYDLETKQIFKSDKLNPFGCSFDGMKKSQWRGQLYSHSQKQSFSMRKELKKNVQILRCVSSVWPKWILDNKHIHKNILNLLMVEYVHTLKYFHWSAVSQEYTKWEHVPGLTGRPTLTTVTQVSMNWSGLRAKLTSSWECALTMPCSQRSLSVQIDTCVVFMSLAGWPGS